MARGAPEQKKKDAPAEAPRELPAAGPGLPAQDSIREVVRFVSPQSVEYQILKTTETDTYAQPADQPAAPRTSRGSRKGPRRPKGSR